MLDRRMKVGDIVLDHPETARVFSAQGIDYCCRGDAQLDAACATRGIDAGELLRALERAVEERRGPRRDDPRELDDVGLIALIVDRHHAYLRQALPVIERMATKVARVHGAHEPRLVPLAEKVVELVAMLEPHLDEEEQVLFPAFLSPQRRDDVIARELQTMQADHLEVGAALFELRALTDGYVAPSWACNTYRTYMKELAALDEDTLRHIHVENHVLLPRCRRRLSEVRSALADYLIEDHARLDVLLEAATKNPLRFDHDAYERFRAGLLRHLAIEEKILMADARARRGGVPLPAARQLKIEHAALAMLTVPSPDHALVGELRRILLMHVGCDEGPGGVFEQHARLACEEDLEILAERARDYPEVRTIPHRDAEDSVRTAAAALAKAQHVFTDQEGEAA